MNNSPKKSSFPAKYILLALTAVCAALIVLSMLFDDFGKGVKNAAAAVIVPLQESVNAVGSLLDDAAKNFADKEELIEENESLEERVLELESENAMLAENQYDLETYRQLYELDSEYSEYDKVAAEVIGKDSGNWFDIFTINKGSDDGIEVDMNVIADGGLCGIVTSVGSSYATVRSIIDDESSVSVQFPDTSDTGIVSGDLELIEDNLLNLTDIVKDAEIDEGAMVVTSDISSKFLPGILVGYATGLEQNSDNLTQSGYIIPVVDFAHIDTVFVITQLKETGEE